MAKSKKRRKYIVLALIAFVLGALTLSALLRKNEIQITVQTEKVKRRNLTELVLANGKIQPVTQVKISPEVSGEIIELPFKEGQQVKKGDLILKIKPDFYIANRSQAEAGHKSSIASRTIAEANLVKAEAEFKRNEELFRNKLISESVFIEAQTAFQVAKAQVTSASHQVEMSKAQLQRAEEELAKTTIVSPLTGTISKLNSQVGERVVGTATMAGTDVMTIADLDEMEARVEIGETDVVLMQPGLKARLEVDAFRDREFTGAITEVANSSKGTGQLGGGGGQNQDATKFEVRIRIQDREIFRPGMSVSAEIETRYRTNVLTVPIASVTTRPPKPKEKKPSASTNDVENAGGDVPDTNSAPDNSFEPSTRPKSNDSEKPIEVVFVVEGGEAKMAPVKIGISDDDYWEICEGLTEGQLVVSGGYQAINRDLEDGKKVREGTPEKK